jgi:hypothetical protein
MWFNPHAKLAEIVGHPPATSATTATQRQSAHPVSRLSQVSQRNEPETIAPHVAEVASVATPSAQKAKPDPRPETFRHGVSFTGKPLTWTGRIVSLDAWRILTEWEKHGPNGRHWNGITKQWEDPRKVTS